MAFISPDGDLEQFFLKDYSVIDELSPVGTLWSWGSNNSGQLGNNSLNRESSPVQTVSGGYNWKSISNGYSHISSIKTDGSLWTWGNNDSGQLGDNTIVSKSSPIQIIPGSTNWKLIDNGSYIFAAIKTDGTLWLCGDNGLGQLGDNTNVNKSTPIQVSGGGTNWKLVSGGKYHTAAIKTDNTLWLWGYNAYGQLGDNTTTSKSTPVQISGGGYNWKLISSGQEYNAAIKTDGTLWLWGKNNFGQLGDNSRTTKITPVQTTPGGTNWRSVSCGSIHTAAIKTDGTLWLWGSNADGKLGNNTTSNKSTPIQTIAGGTNWKVVSIGEWHTGAIKTDGTLWVWGLNTDGQLGDNTTDNKSSPIQTVAADTNWKVIDIKGSSTSAISF